MPITIQATQGILTADGERRAVAAVTNAILEASDALENPMTRRHLIATVLTVPENSTYADAELEPFLLVSVRNPTGSLVTQRQREEFVLAATDALERISVGRVVRDRIYINLIYGDGMWGVGGTAYTDASLAQAFADSALRG